MKRFWLVILCIYCVGNAAQTAAQTGTFNTSIQKEFEETIKINKVNLQISAYPSTTLSAPTHSDCTVTRVPYSVRRRLRLSSFYTQYAHAYGIPVLSSGRVRRQALERACYVMRFLFADRKDIRDWFYRRNGRAGIMAQSEGTTSIPEHSFLPAWWNQRARGLGATIQVPISTGGEENLLCLSGDRYYNEDIFLHEFVHGIHNLGATGAIPGFDYRLKAAYNRARYGGLWRSTYALSTDREYLAEGTQSFFNVNAYSARPNGVHNHVNTRSKLRSYDPTLYGLVKEIFPCQNTFLKRCDAKNGKRPPPFRMSCKNGGGTVVTDKPPTPPVPTPPVPTPPVPTPPKPNTPPLPTPPVPTPPKPNTPPLPTPPVPTPPKPNTPPVPTPPKPSTPPKPNTPPVSTPPKPSTPPNPNTPPVPTPPKTNTPPVPTPPKPNTPPLPTPPKPNTPPVPTPPLPTPPLPTPPLPSPPLPTTKKTTRRPPPSNCYDYNHNCRSWASKGECARNPGYMKIRCCKSCRGSTTNCRDNHYNCSSWASRGECYRNPGYMLLYCQKSCNRC